MTVIPTIAPPHPAPRQPRFRLPPDAPLGMFRAIHDVLVVNAKSPFTSLADLVMAAKDKPGSLSYGSGGNGSATHITVEYLKYVTKTDMLHVPYKGTAPSVTDLLSGEIQVGFTGATAVMPHVRGGRLRPLVVPSAKRMKAYPDLPTVAESGYPGFEVDQRYGIVAPAGMPPAIVAKLNAAINQAVDSPQVRERLEAEGAEADPMPPEKFGQMIAAEIARWRPILQAAKVQID